MQVPGNGFDQILVSAFVSTGLQNFRKGDLAEDRLLS